MDLYEEKENFISSDEYSDDGDDNDALMNDAVRAHYNIPSSDDKNKQPKWRIDQKQKELSSLIRKNKIYVIYKNKSIKWLNNKIQREQYKQRIYTYDKKTTTGQITSTTAESLEKEEEINPNNICRDREHDTGQTQTNLSIGDDNNDLILIDSNSKEVNEGGVVLQDIQKISTLGYSTDGTNTYPEKYREISLEKRSTRENLKEPTEEVKEISGKRMRSTSPSILNEGIKVNFNPSEKKFRATSPQFYKSINDMFPKFDEIATNHIDTITSSELEYVEHKMKSLSSEIDALNEILQAKEMEWNRLLHLKTVKEELRSRLSHKIHMLQLKESFSKKQGQNQLLELKELEFYLTQSKPTSETNHSAITIPKLVENRANMSADDLKREKNKTSRLHSLLVSQNMLNPAESLENTSAISNGEKVNIGFTSKHCEIFNTLDGARLVSNRGRQGQVRDVKSLIADFRQQNPELLPRVGKRIKSTESKAQHQDYSIPLFDKKSRAQYFTKERQPEFYPFSKSVDEISPISRSKKLSSSNIDFDNAVNNHYNVRLDGNFLKNQMKGDFEGKCATSVQYPLCQECKTNESLFVCAGCGNQWYCSKKCQISAWDKHSELCMD